MQEFFYDIGAWLETIGGWAYVIAPLIMAGVAILPIPAEAPAMLNGMLFGPLGGTAITWSGAMLGAVISFELGRWIGRPAVERIVRPAGLARADRLVGDAGWWGLLLARFIPVIAFTALNWGAGLMRVDRWTFLWTTAIGIIPGALVFTASGWGLAALLDRLPWVSTGILALIIGWLILRGRRHQELPDAPSTPTVEGPGA